MRVLSAIAIAFLATSTAFAHVGYKLKVTATYKETKKGDTTFRNIFVTGHGHYPDGTTLSVMVRPESGSYLPLTVRAVVQKEEFAAEMGPWKEGFPAGKYIVEAWFEFDKQSEAVKSLLRQEEEFAKCLKDDPAYQEEYKKANPERYERLMRQIAASGKCASNRQFGACEVSIGSADEAAQSGEGERAFLRDHADLVKDLMGDLMKTRDAHMDANKGANATAETFNTWSTDFLDQLGRVDQEISSRLRDMVFNPRKDTYSNLSATIMALEDLEALVRSMLYGEIAEKTKELQALTDKGDASLDRDQKRRRDVLKKDLAAAEESYEEATHRFVVSMAETRFGVKGLDPAPERKKKYVEELRDEYGFKWQE